MKKVFIIISIFLLLPKPVFGANVNLAENAKSAIMIETTTGEILYEKNIDEKHAPASMTKMMSLLLIMEYIEEGGMKLTDKITVSENASSMGGSQIFLKTGEEMSVNDLLKGVAIASANDAVTALAERVAGTTDAFVNMMNEKAKKLGLNNTYFKNVHGLDESGHYSSAFDMAMIAKELVKHQKILDYSSIYEDYLREDSLEKVWLVNTNKLVRFYEGADGLKTGYTKEAGYCLTATAKRNGMRLITVVMGESDSAKRNSETSKMLDYGFDQYELETLLTKNSVISKTKISKSTKEEVSIVPLEDVTLLHKKGVKKKNTSYKLKLNDINVPVKKGDKIGTLLLTEDNNVIRKIPVSVNENIKKANIFELYIRYLKNLISGDIKL
ncbi:MAG: D-alanyl-D-alanine carboxypeptidase [Firmicutes bacterium]|nr:D-alanyl-D-alanine carboxypeptidase [Bacillota bacterium]